MRVRTSSSVFSIVAIQFFFIVHAYPMASDYQSIKLLMLQHLVKSSSAAEAIYNTYVDLVDNSTEEQLQEFDKKVMDPFMNNAMMPGQCQSMPNNTCNICVGNHCQELPYEEKMMQFGVGTLDLNYSANLCIGDKYLRDKTNYKKMRKWQRINNITESTDTNDFFKLRLLSFNILSQALLELYPILYKYHDHEALPWEIRKPLILEEIDRCEADIMCLQEMQEDHLADFVKPFVKKGYAYLYMKRTHEKQDGLLLMYQQGKYELVDHTKVEFYRPGIELLSRDNVGLAVKFQLKEHPATQFVIATTHLLYNPRRNDVRLGQIQILFSELEKIAFVGYNANSKPEYLPMIFCGDLNLEPQTGVYKFITKGYFKYAGKNRQLTNYRNDQYMLTNSLIPSYLNITDDCQRFNVIAERLGIENAEQMKTESSGNKHYNGQNVIDEPNYLELSNGHKARFSTGYMTHPFGFQSVYMHKDATGKSEASTNQGSWITVDYIFYSSDVRPIEKYTLPNVDQCEVLRTIPNFAVGSDHLSLGATFEIKKKQ